MPYPGHPGVLVRPHVLPEVEQEVMDGPVITKMKWSLVSHVMLVREHTLCGLIGVFAQKLVQEDIEVEIVNILAGEMIKWEDLTNSQRQDNVVSKEPGHFGQIIHSVLQLVPVDL